MLRCAIYTRKSSEEGLEQGFNSLHAQRDACEAYVLSQVGEGWTALATQYDDGGFSGGSMERPGLQQLLADIKRRSIDIVVVYKVDRLTRSLADFARIVELFDAHGVSFVSVTQAFNTTTSMGRLTLNVLLSFAQFEREVTGERIRDKIAASKAKGLWMGGRPPLGYDGVGRKLVVNSAEAVTVVSIFRRYLELGSVRLLKAELDQRNVRTKSWTTKEGRPIGDEPFSRGTLYHTLSNPVYIGAIRHGCRLYDNAHPAILDAALWQAVQVKLAENGQLMPGTPRLKARALLEGLLIDDRGNRMWVSHTLKSGRRYRYYTSAALDPGKPGTPGSVPRIALGVIDQFVAAKVAPLLSRGWHADHIEDERVRSALVRVELGEDRVAIRMRTEALALDPNPSLGDLTRQGEHVELAVAVRLKHRKGSTVIQTPNEPGAAPQIDKALIRAVCLTRHWADLLARGEAMTVTEIAGRFGYWDHYVASMLPLAWLAPDLVEAIIGGRQPLGVTLSRLKHTLPMDWVEQRRLFADLRS